MNERRLVRVALSFELLRDMMDEDYETPGIKTVKGLPSDAVMVGDGYDIKNHCVYLFFQHESFDLTPSGTEIPERVITQETDYTLQKLLERWYIGFHSLRERNDAFLNTIIDKELGKVFTETQEYIPEYLL